MNRLRQHGLKLSVAWAFLIAVLSLTPGNYIPPLQWDILSPDTLAHILFYMILAILPSAKFLAHKNAKNKVLALGFILLAGWGYGFLMEIIQGAFIPGRFFDVYDIYSNGMGSVFGGLISVALFRK